MDQALIWGVGGGIGQALARLLKADGWQVLGVARNPHQLADLDIETYPADLARDSDIAAAAHWAAQEAGQVRLWIYAAGDILARPLSEMAATDWSRIMAANFDGARAAVQHSLPLVETGGHLVFLGAYVERITLPRLAAYAAAKGALEAYTGVLGKELRDRRVSLVRMGAVATPLWDKVPFKPPRQGTLAAEDVAAAILRAHREGHKGALDL
ncbi:MAG: SDR family NAD(P)-dependent oxidoreductase [Roseiflexaceae bacterium]